MATIHVDSELMQNYIAALPVKPGGRFVTCLDTKSRRPMVFGITTDLIPKLSLVKEDAQGQPQLIDFGALLGISSDTPVQTFDCQQANDLTIYLVIALGTANAQSSQIRVVKPFLISADPVAAGRPGVLPDYSINGVSNIFLGSPDIPHGYPSIIVTHKPQGALTASSDITHLLVDPTVSSMNASRDMELPLNVTSILDVAPAANAYGRGLYVLCVVDNKRRIIGEFARYDTDLNDGTMYWFNTDVQTPADASAITTFTDLYGRSALLIACSAGLQFLKCSEATTNNAPGRLLMSTSSTGIFQGSSDLQVSQDNSQITVWSISAAGAFGYTTFTYKDIDYGAKIKEYRLSTGARMFSASVSQPTVGPASQTLITTDSVGNLAIYSQTLDTRLWKSQPFYVAANTTNVAFTTYTINVQVTGPNQQPVSNGTITVTASSQTNAVVNGTLMTLSSAATPYTLDDAGGLAIIIPQGAISCPKFEFSTLLDAAGNGIPASKASYDPSLKVIDKIGEYATPDALGKAQFKDGTSIFQTPPSSTDLTNFAAALSKMCDVSQDLRNDSVSTIIQKPADVNADQMSQISKPNATAGGIAAKAASAVKDPGTSRQTVSAVKSGGPQVGVAKPAGVKFSIGSIGDSIVDAGKTVGSALGGAVDGVVDGGKQVISTVGDIFETGGDQVLNVIKNAGQTVLNGIQDVKQDTIHVIDDASALFQSSADNFWRLVVKIGNDLNPVTFILDTIEKISEGLTFLLKKLTVAWETIRDFFGFLFDWDDIVRTKDTILMAFNGMLDMGQHVIEGLIPKIDSAFDTAIEKLRQLQIQDLKSLSTASATSSDPSSDGGQIGNSTQFKWTAERLKNGGAMKGMAIGSADDTAAADPPELSNIRDEFSNLGTTIKNAFSDNNTSLYQRFQSGQLKSIGDALETIGIKAIILVLNGIRIALKAIVKFIAKMLGLFQTTGNLSIQIPIFSALYKAKTGSDLSIFSSIALVLAIPTNIIFKLTPGITLPDLSGLDKDSFSRMAGAMFLFNAKETFGNWDPSSTPPRSLRTAQATMASAQQPASGVSANGSSQKTAVSFMRATAQPTARAAGVSTPAPFQIPAPAPVEDPFKLAPGESAVPPNENPAPPAKPSISPDVRNRVISAIAKYPNHVKPTDEEMASLFLWYDYMAADWTSSDRDNFQRVVTASHRGIGAPFTWDEQLSFAKFEVRYWYGDAGIEVVYWLLFDLAFHDNWTTDMDWYNQYYSKFAPPLMPDPGIDGPKLVRQVTTLLPTLFAAVVASAQCIKPILVIVRGSYALSTGGQGDAIGVLGPGKFGRIMAIIAAALTGSGGLYVSYGAVGKDIMVPKILLAANNLLFALVGGILSIKSGLAVSTFEEAYQCLALGNRFVTFAISTGVLGAELYNLNKPAPLDVQAVGDSTASASQAISQGFLMAVADSLNFAGYCGFKEASAEGDAVGISCCLASGAVGLLGAGAGLGRFGSQVVAGVLPNQAGN